MLRCLYLFVLSSLLLAAVPAWAAPVQWQPGDLVDEPAPRLTDVRLIDLQLTLDLRAATAQHPVGEVRARYKLRVDGAPRVEELRLTAPQLASGEVKLDGVALPAEPTAAVPPRTPWSTPQDWPSTLGHIRVLPWHQPAAKAWALRPNMTRGDHVLELRYPFTLGQFCNDAGACELLAPYVLGPARTWRTIDHVALEVLTAPNARVAFAPKLLESIGRLSADVDYVLADLAIVAVQLPPAAPPQKPWLWWLAGAVLAGAVLAVIAALMVRKKSKQA